MEMSEYVIVNIWVLCRIFIYKAAHTIAIGSLDCWLVFV